MRDGDDRARVRPAESARARPPIRRRGGWSARRAAADPATAAAAGTAPRGAARRRRASSTSASAGGRRSASIACSSLESRSQAPAASMASCTLACSSRTLSISSGDISSPNFALISSKRVSSARIGATPSSTLPSTVFVGSSDGLLRQVPDGVPGRQRRLALNVVVEARHDLQQRRLARAVRAEHADLGAVEKRETDVLENDGVGRIDLAEPLHGVDE